MAICKILVPYDFSEYSDRALQTAYKLGRPSEIELHLVHVLDDMDSDSDRNKLQRLQAVVLPSIELQSVVHRHVLRGIVHEEILNCAAKNDIEFIVIGTRGRSGILQFAIGSVAQAVMKSATCRVVVVNRDETEKKVDVDPSDASYLKSCEFRRLCV